MKKAVFILGKQEKLPCGNCLMQPAHITGLYTASTYPRVGQHTGSPFQSPPIQISLHNIFPHLTTQLPSRDFEQNLLGNKTATFLKALLEALHASPHPASLFLLKLGTCRPNKAMAHQAACFGLCFHTSELAVPTGCWKRAKENYLACHISSLATASQEEGLKLNGNGNKIHLLQMPGVGSITKGGLLLPAPRAMGEKDPDPRSELPSRSQPPGVTYSWSATELIIRKRVSLRPARQPGNCLHLMLQVFLV